MKCYQKLGGWLMALLLMSVMMPTALAQESAPVGEVLINGDFEQGFQAEFGLGYGWGGFSNGNAIVGWNADTWDEVVKSGQYSQLIQLEQANEADRYAGIYQTVAVVPGAQYKLTINALIRSQAGRVDSTDYEYGVQYAVDLAGGTAWEQLEASSWQDVAWEQHPLYQTSGDGPAYQFEDFQTTITAESDQLTLFIRGWKKWVNSDIVIFNLDRVSLVGPVPTEEAEDVAAASVETESASVEAETQVEDAASPTMTTQAAETTLAESSLVSAGSDVSLSTTMADSSASEPVVTDVERQSAVVMEADSSTVEADAMSDETVMAEPETVIVDEPSAVETALETVADLFDPPTETAPETVEVTESGTVNDDAAAEMLAEAELTELVAAPPALPVTGFGSDGSLIYLLGLGAALLVMLFVGAAFAMRRRYF